MGIEPMMTGVAIRCLTTWLRRHDASLSWLSGGRGRENRTLHDKIWNLVCLPRATPTVAETGRLELPERQSRPTALPTQLLIQPDRLQCGYGKVVIGFLPFRLTRFRWVPTSVQEAL